MSAVLLDVSILGTWEKSSGMLYVFKDSSLQVHEWSNPMLQKTSTQVRRPACLGGSLLSELQCKGAAFKRMKQGQAAKKKCGNLGMVLIYCWGKLSLTGYLQGVSKVKRWASAGTSAVNGCTRNMWEHFWRGWVISKSRHRWGWGIQCLLCLSYHHQGFPGLHV